jgi:hypothetical protein
MFVGLRACPSPPPLPHSPRWQSLLEYARNPSLRVEMPTVPTPACDTLPAVPDDSVLENFANLLRLWGWVPATLCLTPVLCGGAVGPPYSPPPLLSLSHSLSLSLPPSRLLIGAFLTLQCRRYYSVRGRDQRGLVTSSGFAFGDWKATVRQMLSCLERSA